MIPIEPHAEGSVLSVRAQPGGRADEIRGIQAGALKVSVTQSPERGKANKALVAVLAKKLGLKKSQIELLRGMTAQEKRFLVRGITPEELGERIQRCL